MVIAGQFSASSTIRTERIIGSNAIGSLALAVLHCVRRRHVADDALQLITRATCLNTVKLSYFSTTKTGGRGRGRFHFRVLIAGSALRRLSFRFFSYSPQLDFRPLGFARNVTHNSRFPW